METSVLKGPALRRVSATDEAAVRAMFAEQRAMLELVRRDGLWDWLGGMPAGFGNPKAGLYGIYLAVAFVVFAALALIVAGFDRGVWLLSCAALAALCLVARALTEGRAERQTEAYYRRARTMPAVVVAVGEPDWDGSSDDDPDDPPTPAALLVGVGCESAEDLDALLRAGRQLRAAVVDPGAADGELAGLARELRDEVSCDGSRRAAPSALGAGVDVAFVGLHLPWLPNREHDSELLFVLADPDRRDAAHTRQAHHVTWGPGGVSLCGALPWEGRP
jgi:hypothetical protein